MTVCRDCTRCKYVLGRIGFRDIISWGTLKGSPNDIVHASHSNSNGQSLCTAYRSELAWITATSSSRPTVYVAHPLSNDFKKNVTSATNWVKYLRRLSVPQIFTILGIDFYHRPIISAPWLAAVEEDSFHPGGREGALSDCRDIVAMFDEFWMVGGYISDGMKEEMKSARIIRDLTSLGPLPPPLGGN